MEASEFNSKMKKNLKIAHIMLRVLSYESRVLKEIDSFKKYFSDSEVFFLGLLKGDIAEEEKKATFTIIRKSPHFKKIKLKSYLIRFLKWNYEIGCELVRIKPDIVHAHSMASLVIAAALKPFLRYRLVYDAHELEYAINGYNKATQISVSLLEKALHHFVDAILTVSKSIQRIYKERYPTKDIYLVPNACLEKEKYFPSVVDLRKQFQVPAHAKLILYVGGLAPGRGVEMLLEVFKKLPIDYHLVFVGYGIFQEEIIEISRKFKNIHYCSPVSPQSVVSTIAQADLVVRILDENSLSYRLSLPNIAFQSHMAKVPLLINEECNEMAEFFSSNLIIPIKSTSENILNFIKSYKKECYMQQDDAYIEKTWNYYEKDLLAAYGF